MAIAPQTRLQLLASVLTADQEHQLTFKSREDQIAYFNDIAASETGTVMLDEVTYQRRDGYIRYPAHIDTISKYNYVRYQNPAIDPGRWYYAFIERMEYVNEMTTNIYIKTDVFQTWMFDYSLGQCFVEREHVSDDTIGKHTLPEGLELGDYIINDVIQMDWSDLSKSVVCLQVTDFPTSAGVTTAPITMYNGMPSGCYYLIFKRDALSEISRWITEYVKDEKQDAILAIFPLPSTLVQPDNPSIPSQIGKLNNSISSETYIVLQSENDIQMTSYQISASPNLFGDYKPRNNKLYVYPYRYFYLNTFSGTTVEYHYEQFQGPIQFDVHGAITAGGEFKIIPRNLIGSGDNRGMGYGVSLGALPQGSWSNDTYLNWKALNSDAIAIEATTDALTSALGTGQSLWNLDFLGAAVNEINYNARVQQRMNQQRVASKLPNQARGDTATQSLTWSMNMADGAFYQMNIRAEYAKMIDDYFTAFGYLVNEIKTPNLNSRQNWNYIKTVGAHVIGSFPQEDIVEMEKCFDRGITLWHTPSMFLYYNNDNDII